MREGRVGRWGGGDALRARRWREAVRKVRVSELPGS